MPLQQRLATMDHKTVKQNGKSFQARSAQALKNKQLRQALDKARSGFVAKRTSAIDACDDFSALKKRARQARDRALDNLGNYLEQFEQQVITAGGQVHWAETPEQMRSIVLQICQQQNARYITKGKSMVSEEVELNQALELAGYSVDETDLGEYIIQLAREKPSHIVAPALHKTRQEISALFQTHHALGDRSLEKVQAIVDEARQIIRERFLRADVGITGANMLIAETGQAVLVTNEGNGDLTATLPRCHIVTTSIEKIIADRNDASAVLRVLARSATGQPITAYTSFFAGPKLANQQNTPREFHVVLLDNGRSAMLANEYRDMLRCIKCAACMNHCPVYQSVGGHAYNAVYPGPMGSVLTPLLQGAAEDFQLANASSVCGRCDEVCPVEIPLTHLMRKLRHDARAMSPWVRSVIRAHNKIASTIWLYQLASKIGLIALRLYSHGNSSIHKLPVLGAWSRHKDLPLPAKQSFQSQWQQREKHQ